MPLEMILSGGSESNCQSITNFVKKIGGQPDLSLGQIADLVDQMQKGFVLDLPVKHRFTPGIYARELRLPAGVAVVTMVHKTEHPYVVSAGKLVVWTKEDGVVQITAPYCGITKPWTCRLAVTIEPTVWTTFHPNPDNEYNISKLEKRLGLSPREAANLLQNQSQAEIGNYGE